MERLSILLVFASLTQCSYIPTVQIYYGLSERQAAVLNKNKVNQYTAENLYSGAIRSLFEVFRELGGESGNDSPEAFEAILGLKEAIDISYDSVLVTMNDCCSAVEPARKASYEYAEDAAVEIEAAYKLATSVNYWKTRHTIEIHRTTVQEDLKNLMKEFYNAILTCLDTRDHDTLTVIENARNQSYLGAVQTHNAIFNAIKLRATATIDGWTHTNFISDMKDFENKALFGSKQNVEYMFTTLSTFYFYGCLNEKGILPQLAANQYAVSDSLRGYQEGDDTLYYGMIRDLEHLHFGLDNDGQLDISRDDVDVATEIAHYDAGDSSILASLMVLHPNSAPQIAATQELLFKFNAIGTHGLWDLIHAAEAPGAKYSNVMKAIGTARIKIAGIAQNFTEYYFTIIRNNQAFSEKRDAELNRFLKESIENLKYAVTAYLDAIVVLVNAIHRGRVSKDDFSAILALRDVSSLGNDKFTQGISAASLLVAVCQNNNNRG